MFDKAPIKPIESKKLAENYSLLRSPDLPVKFPPRYLVELKDPPGIFRKLSAYNFEATTLIYHGIDRMTDLPVTMKFTACRSIDSDFSEMLRNAAKAEGFIQRLQPKGALPISRHFTLDELPAWLESLLPRISDGHWQVFVSIMPRIDSEKFLDQMIQKGTILFDQAIRIGNNLARVIDEQAHIPVEYNGKKYTGIYQNDIKPNNIIVESDDEVKLLDYGNCNLTGNTGVGTLGYCHPRQLEDLNLVPNLITNTYSFIITMYQVITGEKLFFKKKSETMKEFVARRKETRNLPETKANTLKTVLEQQGISPEPILAAFNQGLNPDQGFNSPVAFMRALSYATQKQL